MSLSMQCDLCRSSMTLRKGQFGQFYGCDSFPKCKGTKKYYPGKSAVDADSGPSKNAIASSVNGKSRSVGKSKTSKSGPVNFAANISSASTELLNGSEEQIAIWDTLLNSDSHMAINAVAGCLIGSTLIDTPRDLIKYPLGIPIKDLVGSQPYVYAFKLDKKLQQERIVIAKACKVWKTLEKAPVYKVTFKRKIARVTKSNELHPPPDFIIGTAEHPILLRKRSCYALPNSHHCNWEKAGYKKILDLEPGDKIMSLHRKWGHDSDYTSINLNNGTSVVESRFILSELYGERDPKEFHAHHKDENKRNQSVDNLEWKTVHDHQSEHTSLRNSQGKAGWKVSGNHPRGMEGKQHTDEVKARMAKSGKKAWKKRRKKLYTNHVVEKVEFYGYEDVYDMEVPSTRNFVANGIVVHNSGKSTTMVQAILRMPEGKRGVIVAFNKHIAAEMKSKLPLNCGFEALTYHGLGYRAITRAFGKVKLDNYKMFKIAEDIAIRKGYRDYKEFNKIKKVAVKMCGLAKNYLLDGKSVEELEILADKHDVDANGSAQYAFPMVEACLKASLKDTDSIDFDDMIYMPVVLELEFQKIDELMIDECFVGGTPILIDGSGATLPISRLVEDKYDGTVYSLNTHTYEVEEKRVIGWHKVALSKKMVRITTRRKGIREDGSRLNPKTEYVRFRHRFVVCTEDHRVFVNNQWTPAKDVKVGDTVIEESIAVKDKSYIAKHKIGIAGKKALAKLMDAKNESGACGSYGGNTREAFMKIRKGNGHGPSKYEQALLEILGILGSDWEWSYAIPTEMGRNNGYPTCYKVDLALPEEKVAIELDGNSHYNRKHEDVKKDAFLTTLGWTILRYNNEDVWKIKDEIAGLVKANSPVEAEVVGVEEWIPRDPFVYDITVEDNHNYFADGILVHNCQDLNVAQHKLTKLAAGDTARVTLCGDKMQSIYSFRGSHPDSINLLVSMLQSTPRGCVSMPLTVTRRCPKTHVALAQRLVPEIQALDTAIEGSITYESPEQAIKSMKVGDMVLCRVNKFLIPTAYALIKRGVRAVVRGREFGVGLVELVSNLRAVNIPDLAQKLSAYYIQEQAKLLAMGKKGEHRLASLDDRVDCLQELMTGMKGIEELNARISDLFEDFDSSGAKRPSVLLSTIHRCVHPDTLVDTSNGLMRIKNISSEGVIATPSGPQKYEGKFTRAVDETIHFTTKRGYELETSLDHGLTVWRDEQHKRVEASEIVVGDWLRLKLGTSPELEPKAPKLPPPPTTKPQTTVHTIPEYMTEELAELIGLIVADGTVFKRGIRVVKRYQSVIDRFQYLTETLFKCKTYMGTAYIGNSKCLAIPRGEISSTQISTWLLSFGGMGPNDKYIPELILQSPSSIQRAFLRGLFEDGTVNMRGDLIDHLHFDNKSFEVAKSVQTMLLRLGMAASVVQHSSNNRSRGIVYLYSTAAEKFSRDIRFISTEKNELLDNSYYRPDSALLIPITKAELRSVKPYLSTGSDYYNFYTRGFLSRNKAEQILSQNSSFTFLSDRLQWVYQQVKKIKYGHSETVCVTVPNGEQFLQNGFDGWNSKGLEGSKVYVLSPELLPHPMAGENGLQAEKNLAYIAATRSKSELVWVGDLPKLFDVGNGNGGSKPVTQTQANVSDDKGYKWTEDIPFDWNEDQPPTSAGMDNYGVYPE